MPAGSRAKARSVGAKMGNGPVPLIAPTCRAVLSAESNVLKCPSCAMVFTIFAIALSMVYILHSRAKYGALMAKHGQRLWRVDFGFAEEAVIHII